MTTVLLALVLLQARMPPAGEFQRGTAEIHGRVTDAETGRPIPRARVQLMPEGIPNIFSALADDDGRYRFTGLAPGIYFSHVEEPVFQATYVSGLIGTFSRPGRFALKEGEVLKDVNVSLTPARAITVRVLDEWGEPLTGLRIRIRDARSRREIHVGSQRSTDDRGRIRVYGLQRGTYTLCAESAIGSPAYSTTTPATRERFLSTCHPSAASLEEAVPIKLEDSDIDGIEIRMRRGRTFRITGVVLDSSGVPAQRASVSLQKYESRRYGGGGMQLMPDGRFVLENVAPGHYAISARLGGPERPELRSPLEAGFVPVPIEASDVEDLVVTMTRTVDVAGRFVLEDPSQTFPRSDPRMAPLLLSARLAGDPLPGNGSAIGTHADERREFRLTGMFGVRTLEIANVPRGWYVKSIRYRGKEITDIPTEFKASIDPAAFEIVLSSMGAIITGRVLDDRGEPVRAAQIVTVPADRSRWGRFDAIAGRSSATGVYRIGPRRTGEYIVLALGAGAELLDPSDHDQLAKLAGAGERVTLGQQGEVTLDLQVIRPR
jgi:protocatechuate 3,4-dioxygenase beta subunit